MALLVLLLVLATTSQGAFAIARWAPVALFALAVLLGVLLRRGSLVLRSYAARVALTGIWGLAALSLLSMLWAQSSSRAFMAADRAILYAAIATLPFMLPLSRRSLAAAAWAITAGVSAIAVYTVVGLIVDGDGIFLAGRLNGPINYRNATALLFAIPVWPAVIAAAARSYRRGVRAGALAVATLCLGLVFLTQSRGILIGLAAGGVVVLSMGPDRIRRAWIAALTIAAVAIASRWLLTPFHAFNGGHGFVTAHQIAVAGTALAITAGAAFAVGLAVALFDNGLRANSPQMRHVRRAARIGLALGVGVLVIAAAIAVGNPVTYLSGKWDQFRSLQSTTPRSTRLLTTSGQRYDLWRVALKEFEGAPVVGVGADNYLFGYYQDRRTNRNLTDPHGLVFALLSENGIAGLILFGLFLGGICAVMRSGWRELAPTHRRPVTAAAAAGAVMIGQSTVDWIWLVPGLTAIGVFSLSAAAAQVAAGRDEPAARAQPAAGPEGASAMALAAPHRVGRRAGTTRVMAIAGTVLALVSVLTLLLSNAYIQRARSVVNDPRAEMSAARIAAAFNPWSVTAHYLEASAYESGGNRGAAYAQLRDAQSLEPANSAVLGVLGDFEARGGNLPAARAYYRRALALNPLDAGLQRLARIGESPGR